MTIQRYTLLGCLTAASLITTGCFEQEEPEGPTTDELILEQTALLEELATTIKAGQQAMFDDLSSVHEKLDLIVTKGGQTIDAAKETQESFTGLLGNLVTNQAIIFNGIERVRTNQSVAIQGLSRNQQIIFNTLKPPVKTEAVVNRPEEPAESKEEK